MADPTIDLHISGTNSISLEEVGWLSEIVIQIRERGFQSQIVNANQSAAIKEMLKPSRIGGDGSGG